MIQMERNDDDDDDTHEKGSLGRVSVCARIILLFTGCVCSGDASKCRNLLISFSIYHFVKCEFTEEKESLFVLVPRTCVSAPALARRPIFSVFILIIIIISIVEFDRNNK